MACKMRKPRKYSTGGATGIIGMLQGVGTDVRDDAEQTDEYGQFKDREQVTWNAGAGSFLDPTMMFTDDDWELGMSGKQYTKNKETRLMNEASLRKQGEIESTFTGTGQNPYTPLLPYGGQVGFETVELEKGEPFMLPDGTIESIPDDAPTHAQGGVVLDLPAGTKVLGKKNAMAGKTFKKLGKKLERLQKQHQKKLDSNSSKLSIDTSKRMLDNVQKEFNDLFVAQGEDVAPKDMYEKGGAVTLMSGVSTPQYRNITPTTFNQQLYRKGALQPGYDTLSTDDINKKIRGHYGIAEGFASPYRITTDDKGNNIYQKDYGRSTGEYFDRPGSGKVIDTYNKPREGYAYGGKIRKAWGGVQAGFGRDSDYEFGSPYSPAPLTTPYMKDLPYSIMNDMPVTKAYNQSSPVAQQPLEQPDSSNQQQWAGAIGSALPIAYNFYQAAKKPDKVNASDYYNPYESEIMTSMRNRRYNVKPELESAKLGQATYNRKLREAGVSQQQYLGGLQSSSVATNRAKGQLLARKQNVDNQYIAEQAQMQAQLGARRAAANQYAAEINAQNQAARRNFMGTGMTQAGQLSQTQQQMYNQRLRDDQLLNLLPSMYANYQYNLNSGYTFKQ